MAEPTGRVEHLTRAERAARGKAARAEVPRSMPHAAWQPSPAPARPGRPAGGAGARRGSRSWCRSDTAACSSRRSRSSAAPPAVMAADLATTPRTGLDVAAVRRRAPVELRHLRGARIGASSSDINDFDETLPGPFEWDVKRLVAELRGRRSRTAGSTVQQRTAANLRGRSSLPRGDAPTCAADANARSSGTRASTSMTSPPQVPHR